MPTSETKTGNKPAKKLTGAAALGAGPGRPKGVPNKMTTEVKEMILAALDGAGGISYLIDKAETHPAAFLSLVGKVLPMQVTGADGGPIQSNVIVEFVATNARTDS